MPIWECRSLLWVQLCLPILHHFVNNLAFIKQTKLSQPEPGEGGDVLSRNEIRIIGTRYYHIKPAGLSLCCTVAFIPFSDSGIYSFQSKACCVSRSYSSFPTDNTATVTKPAGICLGLTAVLHCEFLSACFPWLGA